MCSLPRFRHSQEHVGIGTGMEGGAGGVQLLVEDNRVDAVLKVLGDA
jgi:hypothetical protein